MSSSNNKRLKKKKEKGNLFITTNDLIRGE